jgi:elongation factor P--(R)-beta-lysine ligase
MNNGRTTGRRGDPLRIRAALVQSLRGYFLERDYLEVETPNRIPAPAPELHIDAIPSGAWFLHTSPELCMKRLLASGYPRIFQICKCYRDGERGGRHLPEFTLLEWYCRDADYGAMMRQCEEMILHVARDLGCGAAITYSGREIALKRPWKRITVAQAFERYAPLPAEEAIARGRFEEMLVDHVEPRLDGEVPAFLYDYPVSQGALARAKRDDPRIAERFELYLGGMELANGFSELTDEAQQRERFREAMRERGAAGKVAYPLPENFLQILGDMPAAGGVALGVDRLAMIFTDSPTIDGVVTFPPEKL